MLDTIIIQITNRKVVPMLKELEELHFIKVLKEIDPTKEKLSNKFKGILTKEEGQNLNNHIKQMRSEWNNI